MALGAALAAGSRNLAMLIAGRFWTGFGGWAMMLVGVLYAAEIAPATQVSSQLELIVAVLTNISSAVYWVA
jgi:MFS family permease